MSQYEQQAEKFLSDTGTTFECKFLRNGKYFDNDTDARDVYEITLKRGNRVFAFEFGQSLAKSQYYQDKIHKERKYALSGGCLEGRYKINDIKKYGEHIKLMPGTAPTAYSVLASITKNNPISFENFCDEFGYSTDSKTAEKTYNAVLNEWQHVCMLYTDSEIEMLQEIQ